MNRLCDITKSTTISHTLIKCCNEALEHRKTIVFADKVRVISIDIIIIHRILHVKEGESSIIGGLMKSALDNLANTLLSDENLQRKINNAYAAWETALDVNVPLKMLFSESDKLVPVNEVQEFAQRQRDRGNAAVYTKSWKNVPHCEIGRWHQDEYVRALFEEK